jgi:predicted acetyltransferase
MRLREVIPEDRIVIENLLQLCLHDYSGFSGTETEEWPIGADGRFAYPWLDSYWQEAGRIPLLFHTNNKIVGFALLNQWSALQKPVDHAIAEFFVLRKYRRTGMGSHAIRLITSHYSGQWEVPVDKRNEAALSFWDKALSTLESLTTIETHEVDGQRWSGPVYRFRSR